MVNTYDSAHDIDFGEEKWGWKGHWAYGGVGTTPTILIDANQEWAIYQIAGNAHCHVVMTSLPGNVLPEHDNLTPLEACAVTDIELTRAILFKSAYIAANDKVGAYRTYWWSEL